jgi:hypothetical protein
MPAIHYYRVRDGEIIVFFKKRIPLADYDIASGCLAQYFKKEWIGAIDEAHQEALGRHMGEAVWK